VFLFDPFIIDHSWAAYAIWDDPRIGFDPNLPFIRLLSSPWRHPPLLSPKRSEWQDRCSVLSGKK
jgi:hypothetical protein